MHYKIYESCSNNGCFSEEAMSVADGKDSIHVSKSVLNKIRCLSAPVLACFNIQSLRYKISKLHGAIDTYSDLCAIAIQESWLTDDIDDNIIRIPGFTIHRSDRCHSKKVKGGGSAIYIRDCWCAKQELVMKHSDNNLDLIAIKFHKYILVSIDVNVERNDSDTIEFINSFVDKFSNDNILYLMGDFNRISFRKNFLNCLMINVVNFPTRDDVKLDQIWTNET